MPADPQGTNEEKCYCTHCGAVLSRLGASASGQVNCPECGLANEPESKAVNKRPKRSEHAKVIKFFCTFCNQKLSTPSVFAGKEIDCPNCSRSNTVPGEVVQTPPPRDSLKFYCTSCGQKLSATRNLVGHSIECPVCDGSTLVPSEGIPLPKAPAKLTRPSDLSRKEPTKPATPARPAANPVKPAAAAPKPVVPRPAAPKSAPKPTIPTDASKRPIPAPLTKPKLVTNGGPQTISSPNGKKRPATSASAQKTTPNGKRTAASPPLPKKP